MGKQRRARQARRELRKLVHVAMDQHAVANDAAFAYDEIKAGRIRSVDHALDAIRDKHFL